MYCNTIKSFSGTVWHQYTSNLKNKITREIESATDDYILNVNEVEYINYLMEKFTLHQLTINNDSEEILEPIVIKVPSKDFPYSGGRYGCYKEGFLITISYSFEGDAELFTIRPESFTLTTYEITIDKSAKTVSFQVEIFSQNAEEFEKEKQRAYSHAFSNLANINNSVNFYNSNLRQYIISVFHENKDKRLSKNRFFSAIKVKKTSTSPSSYSIPIIEKKASIKPQCSTEKAYNLEPTIDKTSYECIIKEIIQLGKSMEQKPSLYTGKDEEGLRDLFITLLETRFDSTTVTGETFNHGGKTDILMRHTDGSNVFVAECKIWHGQQHFKDAISQLFDRYLTWRDSKAALMLFIPGVKFSSVLDTIQASITSHPYYKRHIGNHGDSSFSYIFKLPQDDEKDVYLEVIAFNFDKMKSSNSAIEN